jgi:transcriptional regulator with XRE-family HTH domain
MQIAARIRQVRLEHSLSLEDLAAKAGLTMGLLASFEKGQGVPSLETFDSLAKAVDVPVRSLFYGNRDSTLTPWLTPRLTLQELIDEPCRSASNPAASQTKPQTASESRSASPPAGTPARRRRE